MSKKIKAVVMAGGFGTRIQPLTNSIPKPMLPIVNLPMMEHTIKKLIKMGIDEFVILLYFKPEVIKNYFGDGSKLGIKIDYVLPDNDYGTAGAVGFAREYLDSTFIIVSGDLITDFDFESIFEYHKTKSSKLTITLTSVDNPLQFGVVIVNDDGKIEKFLEKPSWGEVFSDTINTGIYIIEPEILEYIPVGENFDFAKELFPLLMKEGVDLIGFKASGYWRDVGNPDSYREVYDDIFKNRVSFEIDGKKIDYPDGTLYLAGDSIIDKSVEIIGTVVIGDNVEIGKNSKLNSVSIGNDVTIGANSKIRDSVIWDRVKIGEKFILDNGVICNDNEIGDGVVAKAGLILAENSKVGRLTKFERDVTIWPFKRIEPASILSHNLVLGSRYKNSIVENGSVIGKSNSELSCEMVTKLAEAYASLLPDGSIVAVAGDHDKSSRMLKRAFLGGLLSAGINVEDLRVTPPSVLRYTIENGDSIVGGAYFRRNIYDILSTEINLFNEDALRIDTSSAKALEKIFFSEKFRRVEINKIGTIYESVEHSEPQRYKDALMASIEQQVLHSRSLRIAVDMMSGTTADIVPEILNELRIDAITLNAHSTDKIFTNIQTIHKKSQDDLSKIVKALNLDAGFILFPGGQKMEIVDDKGRVYNKIEGLLLVLWLFDKEAKRLNQKLRVFLPTWAPDCVEYENLKIDRGVYSNFKKSKIEEYDLVATIDGNFAFTKFALHRDAICATLKILEMMQRHGTKLSEIGESLKRFFYSSYKIECPQSLKGKMMRKFLEEAKGKRSSILDGVKIWEGESDWILMIPDQYGEYLNLYIQAQDESKAEEILNKYQKLIEDWKSE